MVSAGAFAPVLEHKNVITDTQACEVRVSGRIAPFTYIDKEREQDKRRRDFFSAISHELKTPVTIFKGELARVWEPFIRTDKFRSRIQAAAVWGFTLSSPFWICTDFPIMLKIRTQV